MFQRDCSFVKKLENGNPLSRAKAHVNRDVLVIAAMVAKMAIAVKKLVMTVVPILDPVALKKISIIARPVFDPRAKPMSPMVKSMTIKKTKPIMPFKITLVRIERGTMIGADLISSDI